MAVVWLIALMVFPARDGTAEQATDLRADTLDGRVYVSNPDLATAEFAELGGILWHRTGLWAMDRRARRLTVFDSLGNVPPWAPRIFKVEIRNLRVSVVDTLALAAVSPPTRTVESRGPGGLRGMQMVTARSGARPQMEGTRRGAHYRPASALGANI